MTEQLSKMKTEVQNMEKKCLYFLSNTIMAIKNSQYSSVKSLQFIS